MHANNDSLGVRSASVSGSDAEGRPLEVRQSARPTFFIGRAVILGTLSRRCPEASKSYMWITSPRGDRSARRVLRGLQKTGAARRGGKKVIFYWTHFGPEFHSHLFVFDFVGAPYGNRTRVSAVKGRCPGPLDEGRNGT